MPFLTRHPELKRLLAQRSMELKHCESRFRNIMDKTTEGMVVTNLSGEVLFVNATLEKMLERSAGDLIGGTLPFPVVPGQPRQIEIKKGQRERLFLEVSVVPTKWNDKQAYVAFLRDITEQSKNEAEYKKLYRAVLESTSMVMITDVNATIEFVNPKFSEVTGYTASEVIGKTPSVVKSGKMSDDFYSELWEAITSGRDWHGEIINRRKNGELYWQRSSISPVKDFQGRITNFVAVTEDITEEKRRDDAFRKVNRALKTLSEANSSVITATDERKLLYDICHIIVDYGGYAMAWVGYKGTDEEKIVRPVAEWNIERRFLEEMKISWQEGHPRGMGPTGTALRSGMTRIIQRVSEDPTYIPWREQALSHGYGSMVAIALKGEPDPFGVICIFAHEADAFQSEEVDLLTKLAANLSFGVRSLRTRAERRRIESELRATFEQAAVGIAHVSPEGRWLRVNGKLCDILGYTRDELVTMSFQEISYSEDLESDLGLAEQLIRGSISTYSMEKRYIRKDGTLIWGALTVSLMRKEDGSPDYFISVIDDISARKEAEYQVLQAKDDLRAIFNSVYDAIFIHDLDGKIIDLNDKMLEMFEVEREYGVKLSIAKDYSGPEAPVDRLREFWQRVIGGEKLLLEWQARRPKDGSLFWAEVFLRSVTLTQQDVVLATVRDITERKRTEQRVKDSEYRLAEAQRMAHVGSWELDLKTRIAIWSDELYKIFDFPPGMVVTHEEFLQRIHVDDRQLVIQAEDEAIRTRGKFCVHFRIVHPDGSVHTLLGKGEVVVDRVGTPVAMIGTDQDITDLRQAEEAVRESEEKFSKAFRIAPVILAISRLADGVYIEVNEAYERAFGLKREEIIGRSSFELDIWSDPDDRRRVLDLLHQKEKTIHLEVTFKRRAGGAFIALLSADLIELRGEECLLSIAMDITERKRTEEWLMQLSKRLTATLESISDGFFSLDRQWRVTYVNRNAEGPLGRTREELLGNNLWEVFPEAAKKRFYTEYKKVMEERQPVEFEEYYEPYGIWFEARAFPTEEGLAVYFRDVTARKREEEEFERMKNELVTRAAALERANKRLQAYKTAVSAECSQHLAQMQEICQNALKGEAPQLMEKNDIESICDNVFQMSRLIHGLEDKGG